MCFSMNSGRAGGGTRLGKGEFFGEMAFVDNSPRSASAVADSGGAHVLVIDTPNFIHLNDPTARFGIHARHQTDFCSGLRRFCQGQPG
ncbi:MAG TPA: cyclic nucleotide-binding domain-containing protein [Magnetococcales bacterium]|nr:cyclic nucleotide-binding domain-containing protein [Magnetococcales bacterium]